MLDLVVSPPQLKHLAIHWRPIPSFRCSIRSNDSEVLSRARLIFTPQTTEDEPNDQKADLCWLIESSELHTAFYAHRQTQATPSLQAASVGELLAQIEYATLQALLARGTDSFFSLHAALLSKEGRSVIIVGPKEAGKSTLACALWTRCGWRLQCDDAVLVDKSNHAHPAPRRVSLRHGSRHLLGEALWARLSTLTATLCTENGLLFHPHELDAATTTEQAHQPSAIFFLARRESNVASAQSNAIAPALAALALLPYSTFLLPPGEELLCPARVDWGQSLPRLTQFTSQVPAFDLGRGPLGAMIREIERLAFHANPVSAS